MVPKSMSLNNLERCNGLYFALFHRIHVRCRRKTIISVSVTTLIRFAQLFSDYLGKTNSGSSA